MINVRLPEPPPNYVSEVKDPGESFLKRTRNTNATDWNRHNYWRRIHTYLYDSSKGVCAYCASWTPRRRDDSQHFEHTTIDHYIAKSRDKKKAYDWDNFRLCRSRLNNRKADFDDVLDPCRVLNEWFWLEFPTFLIRPAPGLPEQTRKEVKATIDRLELNSDADYVNERIEVVRGYCTGAIPFQVVETRYPFIAYQMLSQDFDSTLKGRFSQHFSGN